MHCAERTTETKSVNLFLYFKSLLGFLIIFPITRKLFFKKFTKNLKTQETKKNNFIDGEFEDIEEKDNDKKL